MLMDTRQLAAFCAVVERKSFSQAAERLGVTQPAVSMQIRALEEQLLVDVAGEDDGELRGELAIGAATGPGATVVPVLLCQFQRENPGVRVELAISDTQHVIEAVARRDLELGVVGATPRHRSVAYEPFFKDEVVLVCPPGHRFAGKTVAADDLRDEQLVLMQEGAGVRQVIEDELRKAGKRLRDLDVKLELGLQESVKSAVVAGYGVTFISRTAVESELAAGTLATARVRGLEPSRQISLVRASGRQPTRVAEAFAAFARERV